MTFAILASIFLWVLMAVYGKRLSNSWAILLPACSLPVFASWQPGMEQWRLFMLSGLLLTLVMLIHKQWRQYILLPSCLVLSGGLAVLMLSWRLV